MGRRVSTLAAATGMTLFAAAAFGQGIAIEHNTVGCIVAEKNARLNACFRPASSLARARAYFRLSDGPPDWYYVEMRSDAPCFMGVLPKPKKSLVGRHVQYYLNAVDRKFAESRTSEAQALVVQSASECDPKLVAPLINGAAAAVFPAVPAGFAGSAAIGGLTTAAIVGGGVAAVAGGVAVAANSGGASPAKPAEPAVGIPDTTTTTLPGATTTTTTTTTTLPGFSPVFKVFLGATLVETATFSASSPATVQFDMCESSGPYRMNFAVLVNGSTLRTTCNSTITFSSAGGTVYSIEMAIGSAGPNNKPKASRLLTLTLGASGCSTDTQGPMVSLLKPTNLTHYPPPSMPSPYPELQFQATADDTTTGNNGVKYVEYKIDYGLPTQIILPPVTGGGLWTYKWPNSGVNAYLSSMFGTNCVSYVRVQAYAVDGCGNPSITPATSVTVRLTNTSIPACLPPAFAERAGLSSWISELQVAGGTGQVVVNGDAALPRAGRSLLTVRPRAGENLVEATLVAGRAEGTWTFDLSSIAGLRPDGVRVIAGEVVQATGKVLQFRLHGRLGERIVFAFTVEQ